MDNKRSEEIAANRLKIIVPLMDTTLDKDKLQQLKEEVCIQTGLSERTIRRYMDITYVFPTGMSVVSWRIMLIRFGIQNGCQSS